MHVTKVTSDLESL